MTPGNTARCIGQVPDALCLEFANTRYWRGRDDPTETLRVMGDVLRWLESSAFLARADAARLSAWARQNNDQAKVLFAELIAVRELVHAIFLRVAAGGGPLPADLRKLAHLLEETPGRSTLATVSGGACAWRIPRAAPSPSSLLAPILWSAGDLLTGPRSARVRLCAKPACQWLFLDDSKSGSRRWCSMQTCGNQAKARRHYGRKSGATRHKFGAAPQDSPSRR